MRCEATHHGNYDLYQPSPRSTHVVAKIRNPSCRYSAQRMLRSWDSDQAPNTPLSTPMAFVANQNDATLTTIRLDGSQAPVISTIPLGPPQSGAIGGVAFSLGEWVFATNTETNKVAAIDPIGALQPILEEFLDVNGPVRLGLRPTRIYRDALDKEVLLTMNEGDPVTGLDTIRGCPHGGLSPSCTIHT